MKPPSEEATKKRVLFLCIGNSCRSQIAEAFARTYGSDAVIPASAGLYPAFVVAPDTMRAMLEKNIDLRDHFPKHIRHLGRSQFDIIVNMSGKIIPEFPGADVMEWDVPDPVEMKYEEHCEVRDQIERMVMRLLTDIRQKQQASHFRGHGSGRMPL